MRTKRSNCNWTRPRSPDEDHPTETGADCDPTDPRNLVKKLQASRKELSQMSRNSMKTLENDRQKMAKELYDGIGAGMAAIKLIAEGVQMQIEKVALEDHLSLDPMIRQLADMIKEVKNISNHLRPSTLDELGLIPTISRLCREFSSAQKEIRIEYQIDVEEEVIPEKYKIFIYRIIREAMTNAAVHASPDVIRSTIDRDGSILRLRITDDGCGFDSTISRRSNCLLAGTGLQSIRARAEICGGNCKFDSRKGRGTSVTVWLPLE